MSKKAHHAASHRASGRRPSTSINTPIGRSSVESTIPSIFSGLTLSTSPSDAWMGLDQPPPGHSQGSVLANAFGVYPQPSSDSPQWDTGQNACPQPEPGRMHFAILGPETVEDGSYGVSDDLTTSMYVAQGSLPSSPQPQRQAEFDNRHARRGTTELESKKTSHTRHTSAPLLPWRLDSTPDHNAPLGFDPSCFDPNLAGPQTHYQAFYPYPLAIAEHDVYDTGSQEEQRQSPEEPGWDMCYLDDQSGRQGYT